MTATRVRLTCATNAYSKIIQKRLHLAACIVQFQEIKLGQTINLENKLMDCFISHRSLLMQCIHWVNDSEIDYVESVYGLCKWNIFISREKHATKWRAFAFITKVARLGSIIHEIKNEEQNRILLIILECN